MRATQRSPWKAVALAAALGAVVTGAPARLNNNAAQAAAVGAKSGAEQYHYGVLGAAVKTASRL
jgi:hypothetical protein